MGPRARSSACSDAHPDLDRRSSRATPIVAGRARRGIASRPDRCSSRSSAIAARSTCCAPTRWERRSILRRRARRLLAARRSAAARCGGGSAAASYASRHATCSASPTCRAVARELAGVAAGVPRRRARRSPSHACRMSVIGMGKLGGGELNYASDVDVLFVHDGDGEPRRPSGRRARCCASMTEPTPDGIVFRTDADLRPEGRAGALSRTLDAYEAYWERWARTWEFQALIKARPVAGDDELGAAFIARAEPFVWPDVLDPDAVREVRAMKARAEEMLRRQGVSDRELKRGSAASATSSSRCSCSRLVHGRARPRVRSRAHARRARTARRRRLRRRGDDAARLDEAYRFLRTVEHRLQLVDEQQTHTHPGRRPTARTHLARVLGYRDTSGASARRSVRRRATGDTKRSCASIHEKLFFAPLLDTLAGVGALPDAGRRGAARRVRLPRRRADPRRAARAHRRPHASLARHAAAAARPARLAVGRARPRPRAAAAAPPDRGLHARRRRSRAVPRHAGRGRAHVPHPRFVARARARAAPPSRVRRRARRRRRS